MTTGRKVCVRCGQEGHVSATCTKPCPKPLKTYAMMILAFSVLVLLGLKWALGPFLFLR